MKVKRIGSVLLITAIGIASCVALPIQAAIREQHRQLVTEFRDTYLALSWGDILRSLRRKRGKGGSRGPGQPPLCLIVPGDLSDFDDSVNQGTLKVWDNRPLFLWQETIKGIEVRKNRSWTLMWRQSLEANARSIIYAGKPLERGKKYFWREPVSKDEVANNAYFEIMSDEEYELIKKELEELERRLRV
ncbi:MAG: hypothetical protein F6K58_13935 [Symploca sp. SIO2E9]|nr:hypothetical protein [Symploca sp. SIO2E9]